MWWEHVTEEIEIEFLRLMRGRSGLLTTLGIATPTEAGARRSIAGMWYVTPHAVARYRQRVRSCSRDDARAELIALSSRARFVRPLEDGCEMWRGPRRGPSGGLRLIVGPGEGDLPALLTVLGEHDDATGRAA